MKQKSRGILIAWIALLTSLAAPAIQAEEKDDLLWVGCGITRKAFMADMAEAFEKKTGVHIEVKGGGATRGIRETASGEADMGGSCRYKMNGPEERNVSMNPVAWDAIVVIVHPDNPVTDISLAQLGELYEGKVSNWNQIGGPDMPLKLFVREGKISGVGRTIRELVFANPDMDFPQDHVFPSSGPLEEGVEKDVEAIAMTGISSARKRKVKVLTLEGKTPSPENIRSGQYMLYRPLYIATSPKSDRSAEVIRFLNFIHTREGYEILHKNGVVPYLEGIRLRRNQRDQWEMVRQRREAGMVK